MRRLERLPLGDGFAIWSGFVLRGAGFPTRWALELSAADLRRSVDEHLAAFAASTETSLARARAALSAASAPSMRAERKRHLKEVRRLENARPHEDLPHALRAAFEAATAANEATLLRFAALDEAATAMAWQNPNAASAIRRGRLRTPGLRLVAKYLQRYCCKNETIGFYGPAAWGSFSSQPGSDVTVRPGARLCSVGGAYFEQWAVDLVAEAAAGHPRIAPQLRPARGAGTVLGNGTVVTTSWGSLTLPKWQMDFLAASDGTTSVRELAARCSVPIDEALELTRFGQRCGLLTAGLEPGWGLHPERELLERLEALDERVLPVEEDVRRLMELRDAAAAAGTDASAVDRALSDVDAEFERITGASASRRSGQAYSGRRILHQEFVRDVDVFVQTDVVQRMGPVMRSVLQAARWMTAEIGRRFRPVLTAIVERLVDPATGRAPFVEVLRHVNDADVIGVPDMLEIITRQVQQELVERWWRAFGTPDPSTDLHITSAALAEAVAREFPADGPGWTAARHVSPDVMLEARGGSVSRIVIGEVHLINSIAVWGLVPSLDHFEIDVEAEVSRDLPDGTLVPNYHKNRGPRRTTRRLVGPADWMLRYDATPPRVGKDRVVLARDLDVFVDGGVATVRSRDGQIDRDALDVLGLFVSDLVAPFFRLAPAGATPRIQVDDVVLVRRQWELSPPQSAADRAATLVLAAEWRVAHRLPRRVYYRVPGERKPFYLDFDSPALVDLFTSAIRSAGAGPVRVAEALPEPADSWLVDGDGATYSAELRLICVDEGPLPMLTR